MVVPGHNYPSQVRVEVTAMDISGVGVEFPTALRQSGQGGRGRRGTGGTRLYGAVGARRRWSGVRLRRSAAGRHRAGRHRHRHPQPLDAHSAETATNYAALTAAHGDRFLLGIGVSHAPLIDAAEPGRYRNLPPEYLDGLDAADPPVPVQGRVLAALGPKMLALAAGRSRGAPPVPDHSGTPRAPRRTGRGSAAAASNRVWCCPPIPPRPARSPRTSCGATWRSPTTPTTRCGQGFTEEDISSISDRLIDAIIAWGGEDAITAASTNTGAPEPTTSASRCSPATRGSSRRSSGGGSRRRCTSPRDVSGTPGLGVVTRLCS